MRFEDRPQEFKDLFNKLNEVRRTKPTNDLHRRQLMLEESEIMRKLNPDCGPVPPRRHATLVENFRYLFSLRNCNQ